MAKSNVILAVQSLRMAEEFMQDFVREFPNSRGAHIFKGYSKRVNWILTDIITYPFFGDEVRQGMRDELKSDVMALPAIFEKIPLLNPEQRDALESLVDGILGGETFEVIKK